MTLEDFSHRNDAKRLHREGANSAKRCCGTAGRAPRALALGRSSVILALALLIGSTTATAADQTTATATPSVSQTTEKDGVHFTVTADRATAQVADPVTIRFRVEAPTGTLVTFPADEETLGTFTVRETRDTFDVPSDKGRTWTRTQFVESLAAGPVEVPGVTIAYKTKQAGVEKTGELTSPTLTLNVASTLPADADPLKFHDIKGEVTIAVPESTPVWWWYAGGTAAVAAAAGAWWYRRGRRPLTAAEWALAELARIDVEDYLRHRRVQELYVTMTDIVRCYIERRFALRAPRQTTPEFLAGLTHNANFATEHKRLLAKFLKAADLVKFACFSPAADDVHAARTAAEVFVRATAEEAKANHKQNTDVATTSVARESREPQEVTT